MKKLLFSLLPFFSIGTACSQQTFFLNGLNEPAMLYVDEISIPSFPTFHSSAVGAHDGKWFIMGGRTNGLHGFYPPFAFPSNGIQGQIYVVDQVAGSVWFSNLDSLPQPLKEQLSSSNMQQCVIGDKMYISGGYGYSATQDEYITFPYLTEVDLPSLSQAVVAGTSPASSFKYVVDTNMAVTGGRMLTHNNRLYLFFGHTFTGRYSTTPGDVFEQEYSYQIRMFDVNSTQDSIDIINYSAVTDSVNFRRRDLNVTPYIHQDTVGFMAWSGVFKEDVDRPHTNQIFIKPDGSYQIIEQIQKCNQYHCAFIPLDIWNQTSVLFLGGMAEYESPNLNVPDTLVPFIKNVTSITENLTDFDENPSAQKFSSFFGTNSEFIPEEEFLDQQTGMLMIGHGFCNNVQVIGYVIGGIESTGPHISTFNDPSLSFASNKIYKISFELGCENIDEYQISSIQVFPNPSQDIIQANTNENIIRWQVFDISGKMVADEKVNGISSFDISHLNKGTYFVKIFTDGNLYRSTFIKI